MMRLGDKIPKFTTNRKIELNAKSQITDIKGYLKTDRPYSDF